LVIDYSGRFEVYIRTAVFFVIGVAFSGASIAAETVVVSGQGRVDLSQMDRIVVDSIQESRLADRGRWGRGRGRGGRWVGPALIGALVGGALLSQPRYYRDDYDYRDRYRYRDDYRDGPSGYRTAKRQCADEYRSYNWDTDTFVTYEGREKVCPYVRPYL
jgi:hypothetical protein